MVERRNRGKARLGKSNNVGEGAGPAARTFLLTVLAGIVVAGLVPTTTAQAASHSSSWKRARLSEAFPSSVRKQLWLADYDAIDDATGRGWLVNIPYDPAGAGIAPRREGRSPIGEREPDPELRERLHRLSKPAAGLLFQIAEYLRVREGSDFVPLEITSMVRPWTYQRRLMRTNANANTTRAGVPPTHVFGLAFDIPRGSMSYERQRILESYLYELEKFGTAIYFKEGRQATFHIVALPKAFEDLEFEYERFLVLAAERAKDDAYVAAMPSHDEVDYQAATVGAARSVFGQSPLR